MCCVSDQVEVEQFTVKKTNNNSRFLRKVVLCWKTGAEWSGESLTLSEPQQDLSHYAQHHYNFLLFFFKQDQYQNFMVRLMQSKSPFQGWRLVCFHSNTDFLKNYNSLLHSVHTCKIWNRSVEKYKSYGKVSMTTYFLSVFCEAHGGQQCIEAQPGVVQYGQQTTRH